MKFCFHTEMIFAFCGQVGGGGFVCKFSSLLGFRELK